AGGVLLARDPAGRVPGLPALLRRGFARRLGEMRAEEAATQPPAQPGHWFQAAPLWFKRAVFYEIHIRGFFDGNGDGSGDFRGLIDKLDYLELLPPPQPSAR